MSERWAADAYDGDHGFVAAYGADVVDRLDPKPGERILDLGCGTGHLTAEIAASGAHVIGLDRAPDMLSSARHDYPDHSFLRGDARALPLCIPFDAIFSNAALHWVPDQDGAIAEVTRLLAPGGRFVGELGGHGNVETIVTALADELRARDIPVGDPFYFPSVGEYASLLERCGLEVRSMSLFNRPTPLDAGDAGLSKWIDMFGTEILAAATPTERREIVTAVEDRLRPEHYDGTRWIADYRRLRFVAVLPD